MLINSMANDLVKTSKSKIEGRSTLGKKNKRKNLKRSESLQVDSGSLYVFNLNIFPCFGWVSVDAMFKA